MNQGLTGAHLAEAIRESQYSRHIETVFRQAKKYNDLEPVTAVLEKAVESLDQNRGAE